MQRFGGTFKATAAGQATGNVLAGTPVATVYRDVGCMLRARVVNAAEPLADMTAPAVQVVFRSADQVLAQGTINQTIGSATTATGGTYNSLTNDDILINGAISAGALYLEFTDLPDNTVVQYDIVIS